MEEYKTECYVARKDGSMVLFTERFADGESRGSWAQETEEKALSQFYNKKIKIIAKSI